MSYQKRVASGFIKRYFKILLPFYLPCIVIFLAVFFHVRNNNGRFQTIDIVGVVLFGVLCIIGLIVQDKVGKYYKCPDCGATLKTSAQNPGDRITFLCDKCQIEYTTNTYISEGD